MTEKNSKIVEELFAVGAHFGYSKSKRHPSTIPFIYGSKEGLDIIDLEKTEEAINIAKSRIGEVISKGGEIIYVANKAEIKDLAPELAACEKISYVNNRWIGGTLTNYSEIRKRINKLKKLVGESEKGEFAKYVKKERLKLEKEIIKLKKYYIGLTKMTKMPDLIVVVDSKDEDIAVKEAVMSGIDVVSISNTDSDISSIKYPILANDRSRRTIENITKALFADCK